MFNWDDLKVFLAAERAGSLGRAAEALGLSTSTVSRRLTSLESALGQALFVRSPDGLKTTAAGAKVYEAAIGAERTAGEIEHSLAALAQGPRGTVRIAVPTDLANLILTPVLPDFQARHPEVCLEFVENTELADLQRWEADIAIRTVRPEAGEDLIMTKLRQTTLAVFAAVSLIDRMGDAPLSDYPWLDWSDELSHVSAAVWRRQQFPDVSVVLRSNSFTTLRLAAASGAGAAYIPVTFGRLTPPLRELRGPCPPPSPLYMLAHTAVRRIPRVDAAWTFLSETLRADATGFDGQAQLARARAARAHGLDFEPSEPRS